MSGQGRFLRTPWVRDPLRLRRLIRYSNTDTAEADVWLDWFLADASFAPRARVGVTDTYEGRSVSNGWGTSSEGWAWQDELYPGAGSAHFSVASGKALITLALGDLGNLHAQSPLVGVYAEKDADLRILLRTDKVAATQPQEYTAIHRYVTTNDMYHPSVRFWPDGHVSWIVNRTQSSTYSARQADTTISGLTHAANTDFWIRSMITGPLATPTLRAKVWQDGTPEPSAWSNEFTDSGSIVDGTRHGVGDYMETGASNTPVAFSYAEFRLGEPNFNDSFVLPPRGPRATLQAVNRAGTY